MVTTLQCVDSDQEHYSHSFGGVLVLHSYGLDDENDQRGDDEAYRNRFSKFVLMYLCES